MLIKQTTEPTKQLRYQERKFNKKHTISVILGIFFRKMPVTVDKLKIKKFKKFQYCRIKKLIQSLQITLHYIKLY